MIGILQCFSDYGLLGSGSILISLRRDHFFNFSRFLRMRSGTQPAVYLGYFLRCSFGRASFWI